jgi:hypothetical protein
MLPKHIRKSSDLVTSHRAVCEGFLAQAQAKTEKAAPYVEKARTLLKALYEVADIEILLKSGNFRDDLITAAGFSDKARNHLSDPELAIGVRRAFRNLAKSAGEAFREEIVYRFLLTKGDALGGNMRNFTGPTASGELSGALLRALKKLGIKPEVQQADEGKIQRIAWKGRRLLFDKTPKIVGKNVDVIVIDDSSAPNSTDKQLLSGPERYVACGELKGGIDPAGADEHWKTATKALDRIRISLKKYSLPLFFVGAAIVPAMAEEIFLELRDNKLVYAANLTVPEQLNDLATWLVAL